MRVRVASYFAALVLLLPVVATGQGSVRGQVRVIEKSGAATVDLSDAIVYLESDAAPRPTALQSVSVAMRLREFEPHVQIVAAGGTVAYPNQDPFSHNVFSNSSLGAFDLGLYRTGKTKSATFPRAGVYAIYCNIHARMVNYVIAVKTPFVARANAAGAFAIDRVPAGSWRLHVWHERAPEHVELLTVPAEGVSAIAVALDGRGYVAKAHTNKFGQPYATTRADRY
jgi:plastocyanin